MVAIAVTHTPITNRNFVSLSQRGYCSHIQQVWAHTSDSGIYLKYHKISVRHMYLNMSTCVKLLETKIFSQLCQLLPECIRWRFRFIENTTPLIIFPLLMLPPSISGLKLVPAHIQDWSLCHSIYFKRKCCQRNIFILFLIFHYFILYII